MDIYITLLIFLTTLVLIIRQPWGLSIGWSAMIGAFLLFILRIVSYEDLFEVTNIVWNATLTFIALVIISLVLDDLGFFEWAALHMAKLAKGNGKVLFFLIILLGAIVSALFANDGAVLILTPIVLAMIRSLKFTERMILPFIMAAGFIADTASLPFVISNLTNIISADYFNLGFLQYATIMFVPNLVSFYASFIVLYIFFKKSLPTSFDMRLVKNPSEAIKNKRFFTLAWYIIILLMISYLISESIQIPLSFVTGTAAIILLIAGRHYRITNVKRVVKNSPWNIIFFSIGMYLVVYGLKNVGLTYWLSLLIEVFAQYGHFFAVMGMGLLATFLSSVMNNLPTVMIDLIAIKEASTTPLMETLLVYANIVGTNLGPKITPIGSLATLLWLHVLQRDGINISWGYYFRVGLVLTIPTIVITLISLYVWGIFVL